MRVFFAIIVLILIISFGFKQEKPVILQEITYQRQSINRKLILSLKEAVLILANICASYTAYQHGHKLVTINTEKQLTKQIFLPTRTRAQSKFPQEIKQYFKEELSLGYQSNHAFVVF